MSEAPEVDRPSAMRPYYDEEYCPDKSIYPPRPSEAGNGAMHSPAEGGGGMIAMDKDDGYNSNPWGAHTYDNDDSELECPCSGGCLDGDKGFIVKILGGLLIIGVLLAFMFMNLAIFGAIGNTSNWLLCLVYSFLGLPVLSVVWAFILCPLCKLLDSEDHQEHTWTIMLLMFITFFAIGIPYAQLHGKERALIRYLDPQMQQDMDCYRDTQKPYDHGSVHFIFLKEREWEVDCNASVNSKMPYEGNHRFYVAPLRYIGKAGFNCPRPILVTCYGEHSTARSCAEIRKTCWAAPPTGVSIRVMNQNEQFYRNWINENDSEAEKFMRKSVVTKLNQTDQHPEPALVTYNGDHPGDFNAKLPGVRKGILICEIFTYVWCALWLVHWVFDHKLTLLWGLLYVFVCLGEICG